jgi:DNA-binding NarL/FixJ family response regulator
MAQIADAKGRKIKLYARGFAGFSQCDLAIIELAAKGLSLADIRIRMALSRKQTYDHFKQIYRRTGLRELDEIARWAFENGLDEPVEDQRDAV